MKMIDALFMRLQAKQTELQTKADRSKASMNLPMHTEFITRKHAVGDVLDVMREIMSMEEKRDAQECIHDHHKLGAGSGGSD